MGQFPISQYPILTFKYEIKVIYEKFMWNVQNGKMIVCYKGHRYHNFTIYKNVVGLKKYTLLLLCKKKKNKKTEIQPYLILMQLHF